MKRLLFILFFGYAASAHSQYNIPLLFSKPIAVVNASTPAVTSQTIGTLRNDYSDFVGFSFFVGASSITVTSLGRWIISGNTGSHTLKIVNYTTGATVVSTTINTSGMTANTFGYAACASTVLNANTTYVILSLEVSGGDFWADESPITVTSAINNAASSYASGSNIYIVTTGKSYVPLNFKYY